MSALICSVTRRDIELYVAQPSSVMLLVGPDGSGRKEIVNDTIQMFLSADKATPQNIFDVDPDSASISIDDVRAIKSKLKLKHLTSKSEQGFRIIVIHAAQRMTTEAQNALLKVLEETPERTLFLMDATSVKDLLDTITSRTQLIKVINPTLEESVQYFSHSSADEVSKAYLMSGGRARYMTDIISDPESQFVQTMQIAKNTIASSIFTRLATVDEIAKRYEISMYLFCLKSINKTLLKAVKNKEQLLKRTRAIRHIDRCEELIMQSNPNTKLLLTDLFMNM